MTYTIGIVGSKGRMGQLFTNLFEEHSLTVYGYDLDSGSALKEFVKKPQILFLSVPISQVGPIIEKIQPYLSENQLVVDITSIKLAPCKALKNLECETLGLHPLFGPSIKETHKYPIAVCKVHGGSLTTHFLSILEEIGFRLIQTTPEKHDQMMAYVQCLPHFLSMGFTQFLKQSPFSERELLDFAPPFFKLLFYSMIRIFAQSGSLYTDIQKNNPYFGDILTDFSKSLEKTHKKFTHSDQEYQNLFEELQLFLGETVRDAKEYTDSFIQQIKNI